MSVHFILFTQRQNGLMTRFSYPHPEINVSLYFYYVLLNNEK